MNMSYMLYRNLKLNKCKPECIISLPANLPLVLYFLYYYVALSLPEIVPGQKPGIVYPCLSPTSPQHLSSSTVITALTSLSILSSWSFLSNLLPPQPIFYFAARGSFQKVNLVLRFSSI